ncbi:amidohydrolase [Salininema proteolyticum]|uniref:Amidohydrolase n=1 Tax=Salininema proteolyticum TaxID=1607685 RepID=A0ABV8TW18_9ACTN
MDTLAAENNTTPRHLTLPGGALRDGESPEDSAESPSDTSPETDRNDHAERPETTSPSPAVALEGDSRRDEAPATDIDAHRKRDGAPATADARAAHDGTAERPPAGATTPAAEEGAVPNPPTTPLPTTAPAVSAAADNDRSEEAMSSQDHSPSGGDTSSTPSTEAGGSTAGAETDTALFGGNGAKTAERTAPAGETAPAKGDAAAEPAGIRFGAARDAEPVDDPVAPGHRPGPGAMSTFTLPEFLDQWIKDNYSDLVRTRRHIHANPCLSREEQPTASYVADQLREAGLKPEMIPDGTGLTCDIGDGEKVIAIRADMDALPIQDPKKVPYRSTNDGVCHACGHDAHTSIVLGVGKVLGELAARGELHGRFRLIFQPSEERFPSGAPTMIKHGALQDVAAVFGFHCDPNFLAGQVGIRNGNLTAACDMMEVRMNGRGGHTSRPHLTTDLCTAISRVVVDMPSIVNRLLDPRQNVAIVFGSVNAGEAANAIPQEAVAKATIRMQGREAREEVPRLVQEVTRNVAMAAGVNCDIDYTRGVPPVVNDRSAAAMFAGATSAALGQQAVAEAPASMGGEDFAYYLEQVPGAMARLGVGRPGERLDIHQGTFDIDEKALAYGVRVMTHTALAAAASPVF